MKIQILVLGIGSPFGDDRLGWEAAEALGHSEAINAMSAGRIEILSLDRPGVMLLSRWRDAETVILLDAIRSGAAPGTRHRLDAAGLSAAGGTGSSHGLGVAHAVELARELGELPVRLLVRGIEADPAWIASALSPPVAHALHDFIAETAQEILELASARRLPCRVMAPS